MIFIDPHSDAYSRDRLFGEAPITPEAGESSSPLQRLRYHLAQKNIEVHTADYLLGKKITPPQAEYYVFNRLDHYRKLSHRAGVRLAAFMVMEPPAVAPHLYWALPELSKAFDRIYIHNTVGDGYSLKGVDQSRLHKLYWPQPYKDILEPYWNNTDRQNRIVVINGNHIPRSFKKELYSKRIEAMSALAQLGVVDLYGMGWQKWWSYRSMWLPYWRHRKALMAIYQGTCASKYEVLSRYRFSLCFENMAMQGYLTEKLFDCLYAGTVPVYLGAPDISELVPFNAYIDCRQFGSWQEMWDTVSNMSESQVQVMREAGRAFLSSEHGARYYDSLIDIFDNAGIAQS